MLKLEQLMEERDISIYKLGYYSGSPSKMNGLKKVLNGEENISSLPYSTLETISRILGITINEILEDFDENGISGQIEIIERNVDRVRLRLERVDGKTVQDKKMVLQVKDNQISYKDNNLEDELDHLEKIGNKNKSELFKLTPSFAFAINCDKLDILHSSLANPFPYLKTEYEFINTNRLNSNSKSISELNREYLDHLEEKDNSLSIHSVKRNYIGVSPTIFIYTPLENGGDFKVAVSVIDDHKDNFQFTEVYGCEWINSDVKKDIVYYKSQYFDVFNPDNIQNCYKERISEVEFNVSLQSQFPKFKIPK